MSEMELGVKQRDAFLDLAPVVLEIIGGNGDVYLPGARILVRMRAISFSIMMVAGSVSGGGMNVPSNISSAVSVSAE